MEVEHHRRIAETIESHQRKGWLLHSHAAAGNPGAISRYLLFERGMIRGKIQRSN